MNGSTNHYSVGVHNIEQHIPFVAEKPAEELTKLPPTGKSSLGKVADFALAGAVKGGKALGALVRIVLATVAFGLAIGCKVSRLAYCVVAAPFAAFCKHTGNAFETMNPENPITSFYCGILSMVWGALAVAVVVPVIIEGIDINSSMSSSNWVNFSDAWKIIEPLFEK